MIISLGAEKPHGIMLVQENQILLRSCQAWSQILKFKKCPGNIEIIPFVFKKSMNFHLKLHLSRFCSKEEQVWFKTREQLIVGTRDKCQLCCSNWILRAIVYCERVGTIPHFVPSTVLLIYKLPTALIRSKSLVHQNADTLLLFLLLLVVLSFYWWCVCCCCLCSFFCWQIIKQIITGNNALFTTTFFLLKYWLFTWFLFRNIISIM